MPIGTAVQRGNLVYAMDVSGRQLFVQSGQLHGFTGATMSVRRGNFIYTYNEQGRQTAVTSG